MPPRPTPAPGRYPALPTPATPRGRPAPRRRRRSCSRASSESRKRRRPRPASTPERRSPATTRDSPSRFLKLRSKRLPPLPDSALGRSSRSSLCLLRCENAVGFHREVLGQSQPVGPSRGLQVPRLDALPELAVVVSAGEGRRVLLRLMLEDGEDLGTQLVLRQRHQHVGFGERPLLPSAAVQPDLGGRRIVLLERARDGRPAHPMGAVR